MVKNLNFGCGTKYLKGYINADIDRKIRADVYFDFSKFPYPFEDNTFDGVYTDCCLEHLNNVEKVMEELHRICKNGTIIEIKVPYFTSPGAITNFHHITYFGSNTFNIFKPENQYHYYVPVDYEILKDKIIFGRLYRALGLGYLFNKFATMYECFFCFIFPARGMEYNLRVIK